MSVAATQPLVSDERLPIIVTESQNYQSVAKEERKEEYKINLEDLQRAAAGTRKIAGVELDPSTVQFFLNLAASTIIPEITLNLHNGTYVGQVKDGLPDGKGVLTYNKNNARKRYEGEFAMGELQGMGILIWKNGKRFKGKFEKSNYHGRGKLTQEVCIWEGEFIEGIIHGKGTIVWPNGKKYEGDIHNGIPEGQGKLTYPNGSVYNGNFIKGKRSGYGEWRANDQLERTYAGNWENDKYHGRGKSSIKLGRYHWFEEGTWLMGELVKGTNKKEKVLIDKQTLNLCSTCTIL
ncbi:MAG: hypothetical protein H0W88_01770 [Parachlamydiaceae bacterium]|nr:hypothetical protein [Parachlamydiaceae bacterium]